MWRFQIGERGQIGMRPDVIGGGLAVGDELQQYIGHIIA
jgi:hypothetical protein